MSPVDWAGSVSEISPRHSFVPRAPKRGKDNAKRTPSSGQQVATVA